MGEIYLVEHDVIRTRAALKVLLPEIAASREAIDRFIVEARASSSIGSPHIPRCHDFGYLPDGRAYVLMELVEGESVAATLARSGALAIADIKTIVGQVADALAAAHERGIVHRDIKPEHVIVDHSSAGASVKVLDFGIAKVLPDSATRTQVGMFMGTPAYCAPEQVLGEQVGPAADIYALGATAYEMLTGRRPFNGEPASVLTLKLLSDPVPITELCPAVPRAVAATVQAMMARDPALRPPSMRAVASAVAAWPTEPAPPPAPTLVIRRRPWLIRGAIAAAAVIAVAVVASAARQGAAPAPEIVEVAVPPPTVDAAPPPPPLPPPVADAPVVAPPAPAVPTPPPPKRVRPPRRQPPSPPPRPAAGSADVLIVDPFQ